MTTTSLKEASQDPALRENRSELINEIAERDQYSGRPLIMITDEEHIINKNPLVAPYAVIITKCGES